MTDEVEGSRQRAGRPTQREQQKQQTRRRLLEAAKQLFVDRGYAGVTIDDIASAVGCSRATFYLHFAGKMDVLEKISAETMELRPRAIYRELDEVLATGSRPEFTRWMQRALAWFEENQAILPAWDEAVALEPEFKKVARQAIDDLATAMPRYLERWGPERLDEARLRIELLVSQLERFFIRWAVHGIIEFSGESAAEVLADIWYPALIPRP